MHYLTTLHVEKIYQFNGMCYWHYSNKCMHILIIEGMACIKKIYYVLQFSGEITVGLE